MKRGKILVVDDDFYVRQLFKDFLEEKGFDVTLVEDAISAISAILSQDFDLVIADYKLPDIFGPELTKKIKCLKPYIPVIGMSAYSCKSLFLKSGADEFFEKPFRLSLFKESVERLLMERKNI